MKGNNGADMVGMGAEAVVVRAGDIVRKERPCKGYRIAEIDDELRKRRTRREAKLLEKLGLLGFPAPKLAETDRASVIDMEFIEGDKLRDEIMRSNYPAYCRELGRLVAILHNNDIIHGDLTTSNMIIEKGTGRMVFIDFGLSFHSAKVEDKAVDLHLLKQAFDSKHYAIAEDAFRRIIRSYRRHSDNPEEIMKRFEKVEERGRNKLKG